MELALLLLLLMAVPMGVVAIECLWKYVIVKRHPHVIPDRVSRRWFRRSRVFMAWMCAGMIWKDVLYLEEFITICATDPGKAWLAHLPVILPAWGSMVSEGWHLGRKLVQAKYAL